MVQKKSKMERPQKNSRKHEENEGFKVERGVTALEALVMTVTRKKRPHFGVRKVSRRDTRLSWPWHVVEGQN